MMTTQEAKAKLLKWASDEVGYSEGSNNYNKYAKDSRLQQLYGWNAQNQPWCDLFTDAAFISCFGLEAGAKMTYQPIGGGSAACRYSADFFKENRAWYQMPEPGDVIFFYYSGAINHQGIVEKVSGGVVYTIEGNSSDMVARRAYSIGAGNIAGFGRPNWSVVADGATSDEPKDDKVSEPTPGKTCSVTVTLPVLRKGDTGTWVKIMQMLLIASGQRLPRWGADGDYGDETSYAVKNFKKANGIEPNDYVEQATWAKLLGV